MGNAIYQTRYRCSFCHIQIRDPSFMTDSILATSTPHACHDKTFVAHCVEERLQRMYCPVMWEGSHSCNKAKS